MKRKKFIKLIFLIILIFIIIKIFFLNNFFKTQQNDDILFLKLFSNINSKSNYTISKNKKVKEYRFKISYKNTDFKSIDLSDTIDGQTLVHEKIAPGTTGSFDILLESNQNLKYKIQFNSKSNKPKNLNFKALKGEKVLCESNTLEELSENLMGYINKNEKIIITIKWYWNFESMKDDNTDIQDTMDSENIKKYQFDIYTIGEELN